MSAWVHEAVRKIEADFQRSADTHLFKLELPDGAQTVEAVLHPPRAEVHLDDSVAVHVDGCV